jgi:hypothetical protein
MNRSQKLHEALALLADAQRPLFMRFFSLKLNAANRKRLEPHSKKITEAFEAMENELLSMIQELKEEA